MTRAKSTSTAGQESGEDFYTEPNGLLVFTQAYHLKRGYCCGSGCRHCPWRGTSEYRGPSAEEAPESADPEGQD